jgi:hypothetical protein
LKVLLEVAKQNFKNGEEVYLIHPENGYRYRAIIQGKREMEKKEHDVYVVRFVERPMHYNEFPWDCTIVSEKYLVEVEKPVIQQIVRRRSWYSEVPIMEEGSYDIGSEADVGG